MNKYDDDDDVIGLRDPAAFPDAPIILASMHNMMYTSYAYYYYC